MGVNKEIDNYFPNFAYSIPKMMHLCKYFSNKTCQLNQHTHFKVIY